MGRKDKQPLSQAQSISQPQSQGEGKSRQYITWNTEMDTSMASVLYDQVNQGHKGDEDWKPQAYQAVVNELNVTLILNLTKDNVKNRLKAWKRHYGVITDIKNQSVLAWDEDRKTVTAEDQNNWNNYLESHLEARGYQNKVIENWDDIVILCGKDRATGEGAENCDNSAEAMAGEGKNEVNFIPGLFELVVDNDGINTSRSQPPTHPSTSTTSVHDSHQKKRARKDTIAKAIIEMAISLKEYLARESKIDHNPQERRCMKWFPRCQNSLNSRFFKQYES